MILFLIISWTYTAEVELLHFTNFPAEPISLTEIHVGATVHNWLTKFRMSAYERKAPLYVSTNEDRTSFKGKVYFYLVTIIYLIWSAIFVSSWHYFEVSSFFIVWFRASLALVIASCFYYIIRRVSIDIPVFLLISMSF